MDRDVARGGVENNCYSTLSRATPLIFVFVSTLSRATPSKTESREADGGEGETATKTKPGAEEAEARQDQHAHAPEAGRQQEATEPLGQTHQGISFVTTK